MIAKEWEQAALRLAGVRSSLTRPELRKIEELGYAEWQVVWAIRQYMEDTPVPMVAEFLAYLDKVELPKALVAQALCSDEPMVVGMAEQLRVLQAAWQPTAATQQAIEELEAELKALL